MGRRAVLERVEQEAEPIDRFLAREPQQFKYLQLQLAAMDTNRTAAEFLAVEHHIVGECARLERRRLEHSKIVGMWRGEWMVHRDHALVLGAVVEQREIDDPQKFELVGFVETEFRGELQADVAENWTDLVGRSGHHQQSVAGLQAGGSGGGGSLAVA